MKLLNKLTPKSFSNQVLVALLAGVLILPVPAMAQSDKLKDALDQVNENLEALDPKTGTDPASLTQSILVAPELTPEELATHQQALISILNFSIVEVEEVLIKLRATTKASLNREARSQYQLLTSLLDSRREHLLDLDIPIYCITKHLIT